MKVVAKSACHFAAVWTISSQHFLLFILLNVTTRSVFWCLRGLLFVVPGILRVAVMCLILIITCIVAFLLFFRLLF